MVRMQKASRGSYKKFLSNDSPIRKISRQTRANIKKRLLSELIIPHCEPASGSSSISNVHQTEPNIDPTHSAASLPTLDEGVMDQEMPSQNDDAMFLNDGNDEINETSFETTFLRHGGRPLFPASKISENESTLLIMGFMLRYKLSAACTDDVLKLIAFHLPNGVTFPLTTKQFQRRTKFSYTTQIEYHCSACNTSLGKDESDKCLTCNRSSGGENIGCYIHFDLRSSIEKILKVERVAAGVQSTLEKRRSNSSLYEDIYSGKMYKKLCLKEQDLSLLVNSDGIPVFKSSRVQLYPILVSLNELSYALRREFTIVAAIYCGKEKPNFDKLLEPFIEQCNRLNEDGVRWKWKSMTLCSKVHASMLCADSIARCSLQGLHQHNGSHACPSCLIKGQTWKNPDPAKPNSRKWVYKPVKKSSVMPRSHQGFLQHLREFRSRLLTEPTVKHHYGILKASRLLLLKNFDIVTSFVFDVMHTAFLGVARSFLDVWFNTANSKKGFYLGDKTSRIDKVFLACLVPYTTQRPTRSLVDRKFWKAHELKIWVALAPVVLKGMFRDEKYLTHFELFSNSILGLCRTNVQEYELVKIEKALYRFSSETEKLYTLSMCSSNLHLVLHAVSCVRNWGPLFAYSAFQFEHMNGILVDCFNGTQAVAHQIAKQISDLASARLLDEKAFENTAAYEFYDSLVAKRRVASNAFSVGELTLLGYSTSCSTLTTTQKQYLLNLNITKPTTILKFDKIIIRGVMYNTFIKRTTKRCSSVVKYDNNFYLAQSFVYVREQEQEYVFAEVSKLITRKMLHYDLGFKVIQTVTVNQIIDIDKVERCKFVCVMDDNMTNPTHIVQLPNVVELE